MNRAIVYLIGILNVCFVTFPLEQAEQKRITDFLEGLRSKAGQEEFLGDSRKALSYYNQIILTQIPPSSTATYTKAHEIQTEARDKIISAAEELEKKQDYKEALSLYSKAYNIFKDKLEAAEKKYRAEAEEQGGDKLIDWVQRANFMAENAMPKERSFFYYGLLADVEIPLFAAGTPDSYKEAREIRSKAKSEILKKGRELEKEKKYEEVSKLYNYAPLFFHKEIQQLKEEQKKSEEDEEIAKAVKIAQDIINTDNLAESQPSLKLKLYGNILKLSLHCPSGAPEACTRARDIQKKAQNAISDKVRELNVQKQYLQALDVYEYAGDFFHEEIEKLGKLIDILPELRNLAAQNKYDEAYKKLDDLITQGIKEAETYKKDLELQKAEKQPKVDDPLERAKKMFEQAALEQQQRLQESLAQAAEEVRKAEEFKKATIELTEKLRSLAQYITSHAPL